MKPHAGTAKFNIDSKGTAKCNLRCKYKLIVFSNSGSHPTQGDLISRAQELPSMQRQVRQFKHFPIVTTGAELISSDDA